MTTHEHTHDHSHEGHEHDHSHEGHDHSHHDHTHNALPEGFQLPPGHPMPPLLTAPDAKTRSSALVSSIFSHHATLNSLVSRHEEALRRRWLKKTQSQRRKILLEAWPSMPPNHRPDYHAFRLEPMEKRQEGGETEHADAFAFPYVNLEDLCKPRSLLLFISSRAKVSPDKFALADGEATRFGRLCYALTPAFLNEHTMLLSGYSTPETYGKIVSWSEDPNALELLMAGDGVSPGEGIQILEIQEKVLKFLVDCCCLIMNSTVEALTSSEVSVQPEPAPLPVAVDEAGWKTLKMVAEEASYRDPIGLDFARLKAIVGAKRLQAEDHVWCLREDPGYFEKVVEEYSENRNERVLDADDKTHPILDTPAFWERVLGRVVTNAHGDLAVWEILYRELEHVLILKEKYAAQVTPATRLPRDYERVFVRFQHMLNQLVLDPLMTLKLGAPGSPPLRDLWTRVPGKNVNSNVIQVQSKAPTGKDELLSLFDMLWDEKKRQLVGLDLLVDELERLIRSDPKQAERISGWAADVVSDLAVFAELQRQVRGFQPWASSFEAAASAESDEIQMDFSRKMSAFVKLNEASKTLNISAVGNPSDGRFNYPTDKKPSKASSEGMRTAEKNLDAFWDRVDKHFGTSAGKPLRFLTPKLVKDRTIIRTPLWVEPERSGAVRKKTADADSTAESLKDLSVSGDKSSKSAPSKAAKVKSTSVSASNGEEAEPSTPTSSKPTEATTFKVDKRALKVLNAIFFPPTSDNLGEIVWLDFVHAMSSIGFEPEKFYGSVWMFNPTAEGAAKLTKLGGWKGACLFNEPHPAAKMSYKAARRLGRRLNRIYGLEGSMFVLA